MILVTYLKLNNNPNHLSLGNLFNEIKKNSINKSSAIQTEIFCILFNIENISDTTVGNYCTGYRAIGNNYKQIYLIYQKKWSKDKSVLIPIINNLLSIMTGQITSYDSVSFLNTAPRLKTLAYSIHPYIKNDLYVPYNFKNNYLHLLKEENYYECICQVLFFTILEKKQPIYDKDLVNTTIDEILRNTNISVDSLKEYLELKFSEGISLIPSLKSLASKNNPYALNELGNLEYMGYISGTPNYELAYSYHELAANYNHPTSCWILAHMILTKKIGSLSNDDLSLAWSYLKKAESLNSVSSLNTLGLCYLSGTNPHKEINLDKAISYFNKAISRSYPYAYNNLGKIYEEKKDYQKAFSCYLASANMEESWACNKVGLFYLKGLGTNKDLSLSYKYFTIGSTAPKSTLYPWNIINLVTNFYIPGCASLGITKDLSKSIQLLESISSFDKAQILLLTTYYELYLSKKEDSLLSKVKDYLTLLNNNPLLSKEDKDHITSTIKNISSKITIDSI